MPGEWPREKLKQAVVIAKGRIVPNSSSAESGFVPYIGAAAFEGSTSSWTSSKNGIVAKPNDVLMLWDGERSGLVATSLDGVISSTVARLRPNAGWESRYLAYFLKSRFDFIQSRRTGTGVPHVPKDLGDIIEIPKPSFPEQRRIAEILDTLDRTIEGTQRVIEKLQSARQGLLHDLLTRGLDEHGQLRDPECHPDQFHDTELGRLPVGWEVDSLHKFCEVKGGKRLPAGHTYAQQATEYAYLRVTDFFDKSIQVAELPSINPVTFRALRRYEITPGDACISIAGSIGRCATFPSTSVRRVVLTENAARIIPSPSTSSGFMALVLNSPGVQSQIALAIGTGGGVPKLALFRIEQLLLPMPSLMEQARILSKIASADERLTAEEDRLAKLQALKQGLMDDLLTGRVRVPVAEVTQ